MPLFSHNTRFRRFHALLLPAAALLAIPGQLWALSCSCPSGVERCLCVGIGTGLDVWTIAGNVVNFLAVSIGFVALAMFMVGALMVTLGAAKEDFKQRGKDLIVGSAISIIVVLGAYAIYRTVACFLSPSCTLF